MENKGYAVSFVESTKELTSRQIASMINFSDMIQLNDATKEAPVLIDVDYCCIFDVHNDKSDNKDYRKYIYVDRDGQKYITGSESLYKEYINICKVLEGAGETAPWTMKVLRSPSSNNQGDFLTCVLAE